MENQTNRSLTTNLRLFFHRSRGLVSVKRRKYRIHQQETKKMMDRILEIKNKHPELSKYLSMIPEFRPNIMDSESRVADLRKYHIKLLDLLEKYELESKTRIWFT